MNRDNILFGVGGLVIGAVGSFFATRYFVMKQKEEEIQQLRDYYQENYVRKSIDMNDNPEDISDDDTDEENNLEEVKKKLEDGRRRMDDMVNYGGYYTQSGPENHELAEKFREEDYSSETEDILEEQQKSDEKFEEMSEDHKKNIGKPPKIVSYEYASQLPETVDWQVLYYYEIDDIVATEEEQVIDEPGYLLGTCLEKYGFADSNETTIYIYNPSLETVYEVTKMGEWPEDKPYV